MSIKDQIAAEAAKVVVPGSTLTLTLFGVPISQWAAVLSVIVLLVQLAFMIYNQWRNRGKSDS